MIFGTGAAQVLATDFGVMRVIPTGFTLLQSCTDFTRIEMSGLVEDLVSGEVARQNALGAFSIVELAQEIRRRVQQKENLNEKRKS